MLKISIAAALVVLALLMLDSGEPAPDRHGWGVRYVAIPGHTLRHYNEEI